MHGCLVDSDPLNTVIPKHASSKVPTDLNALLAGVFAQVQQRMNIGMRRRSFKASPPPDRCTV